MKKQTSFHILIVFLTAAALLLAACKPAATETPAPTAATSGTTASATPAAGGDAFAALIPQAQAFVDQLVKGDFAGAVTRFDAAMKGAMPESKLKDTWAQLGGQVGAFKSQLGTRTTTSQGYNIVFVTCQFEKAVIDVRVVYNAQAQISGLFFNPGQAPSTAPTAAPASLTSDALGMVDQIAKGDYTAFFARCDDKMKAALTPASLKQLWDQTLSQMGAFKATKTAQSVSAQGYNQVFVTATFEKGDLDVVIVFNAAGQVSGLRFAQAGSAAAAMATPVPYSAPAYVKSDAFKEIEVTIGSGQWALPGTLTLPSGGGPFPAVVLVHGSGPNDRDETIGPNKPFRDLAWGLASQGIAVLRYDKRTKAHAAQFTPDILAKFTVNDETVDDAVLAAQLLRQTPTIDPKRVFVAGHSLGATVAPRIGQREPALAGLVVLAGITRPLEDVVVEQYTYLYNLSGSITDAQKAEIEKIKAQAAKVKDPALSAQTPTSELPLNTPAAYWLDLRDYHPAEVAKTLSMPMLILQGERDYQVSPKNDFPGWQSALAGKSNATFKLYPGLNHLFIKGEGQPSPEEYSNPGHVSADVVADIAAWIKK